MPGSVDAAAGDLDLTFGSGGKVTTNFPGVVNVDNGHDVAIQSDGKIVVAGLTLTNISAAHDFALARYNTDGSLDSSFGVGGRVNTQIIAADFAFAQVNDVVIQGDGKIVAAGGALGFGTFADFALARYNTDGSLDTSFGVGGKVTTDFSGFGDEVFGAALQGDGKIVVAGTATSINSDFAVARYNGDSLSFDICLQDESNGNRLLLNTATGDYLFTTCRGVTVGGRARLTQQGCAVSFQHLSNSGRVTARIDSCARRGSASFQSRSLGRTLTIIDRNTADNACSCP
jgi:uncharacterized delta-60 repeat protein